MPACDIRPLDAHDEAAATAWYAALRAAAVAERTAPLVISAQPLLMSLRRNDIDRYYERRALGAWAEGSCVGVAQVDMPRRDNTHLAEVEVAVVPAARRQGIGSALLARALEVVAAHGRSTVCGELNVPAGATLPGSPGGFALRHGFTSKHTEDHLVLDLPVPADRLAELTRAAEEHATGYRAITWQGPVPDRWLPHYTRMLGLMQHDSPTGELNRNAATFDEDQVRVQQERQVRQGYGLLSALVLTDDDEPAGYSDVFLFGDEVMQDDTFVLRAHRGRRLGTLAKVATLRGLARHHPDAWRIHTWNAEANDPMQGINRRFGFRSVETTHTVSRDLP
jgi:GNAT superfamily N-acetyltransferase